MTVMNTPRRSALRAGWSAAMLATTVMALLPVDYLQHPVFNWWDKAQHALAFGVLSFWALKAWPPQSRTQLLRWAARMVGYGALIEVVQGLTGWRYAEWADLGADSLGVFVAVALIGVRSPLFSAPNAADQN